MLQNNIKQPSIDPGSNDSTHWFQAVIASLGLQLWANQRLICPLPHVWQENTSRNSERRGGVHIFWAQESSCKTLIWPQQASPIAALNCRPSAMQSATEVDLYPPIFELNCLSIVCHFGIFSLVLEDKFWLELPPAGVESNLCSKTDTQIDTIHCSARGSVAHTFLGCVAKSWRVNPHLHSPMPWRNAENSFWVRTLSVIRCPYPWPLVEMMGHNWAQPWKIRLSGGMLEEPKKDFGGNHPGKNSGEKLKMFSRLLSNRGNQCFVWVLLYNKNSLWLEASLEYKACQAMKGWNSRVA